MSEKKRERYSVYMCGCGWVGERERWRTAVREREVANA